LVATLIATVLVLVVSAVLNVVSARRRRHPEPTAPQREPCESA
jgi:hypothetical protein